MEAEAIASKDTSVVAIVPEGTLVAIAAKSTLAVTVVAAEATPVVVTAATNTTRR